jgi:hypothetical protein
MGKGEKWRECTDSGIGDEDIDSGEGGDGGFDNLRKRKKVNTWQDR